MMAILEYLDGLRPDPSGESWTLVTRIMADLNISREEIFTKVMEAMAEGLVGVAMTLEPGPYGRARGLNPRVSKAG